MCMDLSEIDAVRALLASRPRPVGWQERRMRLDEVASVWPVAGDVKLTEVDIEGVPGEWSAVPGSDPSRVLLYFHGGGYCSGSILSHRRLVTEAGRAAGICTLAIGYRLAPEHPFPAALDDAFASWRFLRNQEIAPAHIIIGGDSAGAGIVATLTCRLRDAGDRLPGCVWLVSPWTDLTMQGATLASKDAVDPLIHKAYLTELADAYLPAGIDRKDPRVSPLYADLSGFPPMLIQVGSDEALLDDATRFAGAAGAAGVAVTLEIWPRMIHAWPLWNAHLDQGAARSPMPAILFEASCDRSSRQALRLREVEPHLAITLRIVRPITAHLHKQEQMHWRLDAVCDFLPSFHRDLLDRLPLQAKNDLALAFALHKNRLIDADRTVAKAFPVRRFDRGRIGNFLVQAQKHLFARDLGRPLAHWRVGDLVFRKKPNAVRHAVSEIGF